MRTSLESLLADSLGDLRQLSEPVVNAEEQTGPVEGLTTITAAQISEEVLGHVNDERYNSEDACREVCNEYIEKNEEEHAALRRDVEEVAEVVNHVVAAMEMMGVVTSMESIDAITVNTANTALANIGVAADVLPPVLIAEDGQLTSASMEGVGNFLKELLGRLKKWIKEKFENIAISMRRGSMAREVLQKRITVLQDRISAMPDDYGIPVKALRLDPGYTIQLFSNNEQIPMTANGIKAAAKPILEQIAAAVTKIHPDTIKRSDAIADVIASILVARDEVTADEQMKKLFKDVTHPLPAASIPKLDKEIAGVTFFDGAANYRSRYRDADWIMALVNILEKPAISTRFRRNGRFDNNYIKVEEIADIVAALIDVMENEHVTNTDYFDELVGAWRDADKVYSRLWEMVMNMEFNHMTQELWRAFDIAVSGMFTFLDKAYFNIEALRTPYFRLVSGTLYVMEEQMKGYVAVNR